MCGSKSFDDAGPVTDGPASSVRAWASTSCLAATRAEGRQLEPVALRVGEHGEADRREVGLATTLAPRPVSRLTSSSWCSVCKVGRTRR